MTTFINYQCSVCRKSKSIEEDNIRAIPTLCTITKGCNGMMIADGETTRTFNTDSNWFPRNAKVKVETQKSVVEKMSLMTSANGIISLGVLGESSAIALSPKITLVLNERSSSDFTFTEYEFKLPDDTKVISGRDRYGKTLRIGQSAIDDARVSVRVNGVVRSDFTLSNDSVVFNDFIPQGAVVGIQVYDEVESRIVRIELTRNDLVASVEALRNAWSNIKWVNFEQKDAVNHMWVYSGLVILDMNAEYQVVQVENTSIELESIFFLLSLAPHNHIDRIPNALVPVTSATTGYPINGIGMLSESLVLYINPPLKTETQSYLGKNEVWVTTQSGQESIKLKSTILGPL
jgi:hypothetical protein